MSEKEIHKICDELKIDNYTINPDGSIDVEGEVIILIYINELPIKFNKVNGNFYCHGNKLESFEYAPKIIRGDFGCEWNNIKSFEYFPSFVKDDFLCIDIMIIFQIQKNIITYLK